MYSSVINLTSNSADASTKASYPTTLRQQNCLISWSGGKDSYYALQLAVQQGYTPKVLLNVLNEQGQISRSHGIPLEILTAQAAAIQIPLHTIASSWKNYETNFITALRQMQTQYAITHAVFGDIDLQAHRDWEEKVCTATSLTAVLPLWQRHRKALVLEMLEVGIETIIVSCNTTMGISYLGQTLTPALIESIEALGIDACGENGEYHTLTVNAPLFHERIQVTVTATQVHNNYCFAQLQLAK